MTHPRTVRQEKLSQQQRDCLYFLARAFPYAWMPHELDRFGTGTALITVRRHVPALRALFRKGLAEPYPKLGKWACILTEKGRRASADLVQPFPPFS